MRMFRPANALRCLGCAIILLASAPAFAEVVYSTSFDGSGRPADWQVVNAPSDNYWILLNGEFLTGNGDNLTEGDGRSFAVLSRPGSSSWDNYTVSSDVWMSQRNGTLGLVGRWQSPSEHYEATIEINEDKRVARIERIAGALGNSLPERKVLAQGSVEDGLPIPALAGGSSSHDGAHLSLSFDGSNIVFSVNGRMLLKATDDLIKTGSAGLLDYQNFAYYDNFTVEKSGEAMAAAGAMPAASATPRPRFTPVPVSAIQAQKLPTINKPVPSDILAQMDLSELTQRLTPQERALYDQMSDEDKVALLRNISTRMNSSAGPANAEMAAKLANMEKELDQLTTAQKQISDSVTQKLVQEQKVAEGLTEIETLQDTQKYPEALAMTNDLLRQYPENSSVLEKKRTLEKLSKGTYEGYDVQLSKNEKRFADLSAQAKKQEADGNLQAAVASWTTIIGMSPSRDEWLTQANGKIRDLNEQVQAKTAEQDKTISSMKNAKIYIYAAITLSLGLALVVLIILSRFHRRSQARDAQILAQVKDLTQPLVDMHAEIKQLKGGGAMALPGGIGSDHALPQLPPMDAPTAPQAKAAPVPAAKPAPAKDAPAPEKSEKKRKKYEMSKPETPAPAAASSPLDDLGFGGFGAGDDLFADDLSPSSSGSAAASSGNGGNGSAALDDFADGFGDLDFSGPTLSTSQSVEPAPAKAQAKPEAKPAPVVEESSMINLSEDEDRDAPLDLGLDDVFAVSSMDSGGADLDSLEPEMVGPDSGGISLVHDALDLTNDQPLNLDFDLGSSMSNPGLDLESPSASASAGPVEELSIDLFDEENNSHDAITPVDVLTPEPISSNPKPAAPAAAPGRPAMAIGRMGVVYQQDFENERVGDAPQNWTGEEKTNVFFHVAESNGRKVLRYFKNAGTDLVHYYCQFPNVAGVIAVEFDVCCPQKNKYLLGLYIERDLNYNQAIRTIVHCLDPSAASLRMQNEPVPYKLGDWRHVRYLIDLNEGTIDGMIDGEPVLTQQTFMNKPSSINTLSIRDNHATTGELLIGNIKIEKLS